MPWAPRQVRYLESKASPLTSAQTTKMNAELHDNPALGHQKKGARQMRRPTPSSAGGAVLKISSLLR